MYLKALEIQGFKSFADKTRLTFEKDITAIVGPNGSGKSNISDALLWVMGEQRTKALRGGKMEDVIFGGTEKRPKMGFAQVSLIIDNTDKIFDLDSTEVMITRRYYRSGESEYYINKEAVRLKDITELLMDTGLGRYGYSVIGQGRIAEIVSAKSTDRREIFEEAAGISRYRYRKDESERKLMHTEENLLRINDKIDELKIQVEPLKKQSEIAKKYLILRDKLRLEEVSVWMETLDNLADRAKTVENDWAKAKEDLEKAQSELNSLYSSAENFSEKMKEKDLESESARQRLAQVESLCAEKESALAVLRNSAVHNEDRRIQLENEIGEQGERSKNLSLQIEAKLKRADKISQELEALENQLSELTLDISKRSKGDDERKRELEALFEEKNDLSSKLSHLNTVVSMLEDQEKQLSETSEKREKEALEAKSRLEDFESRLEASKSEKNIAEDKIKELSNILNGYKMRLESKTEKVKALEKQRTKLTIELNSTRSRANMLSEMEKDYEGYSRAVKTVMRESGRGNLKGVYGPVANLVKTDDEFALAIETALGGSMQSIVVDTQEQGKAAIELLKRQEAGRATFLPVNTIKPYYLNVDIKGEQGYLGTAFELAHFDDKFRNIFANLLGKTVVAENMTDAIRISKKHDNRLRIVTLDGQLINAGGSMTGGSSAKNAGIISRANELKTLKSKINEIMTAGRACEKELKDASVDLEAVKSGIEETESKLKDGDSKLRESETQVHRIEFLCDEAKKTIKAFEIEKQNQGLRMQESQNRAKEAKAEISIIEEKLCDADRRMEEVTKDSQQQELLAKELSDKATVLSERRSSLISERDITLNSVRELKDFHSDLSRDETARREAIEKLLEEHKTIEGKIEEEENKLSKAKLSSEQVKKELSEMTELKLELEGKRTKADREAQEKNKELLELERSCASLEQKKLASEMEEKQIIDKLWDSYELSRTAAQQIRCPIENVNTAMKSINGLKREIALLGTPNLGSIEEYERVSTRYEFLTEQRDDVEKAKKDLLKIIAEITSEMKEIFASEFKAIDESFRTTFLELFGGGRASLILEDEEDILNCGIEIKVQPPGKALSTISLMSGGEKAFVAIALYFAIMKVRPAPFCVMDEIEAALDESNVARYASYMRKLAGKTQFIVITHRRGTMEESDVLYGVTMQEKGVSQVLSVDLEEAEKAIAG